MSTPSSASSERPGRVTTRRVVLVAVALATTGGVALALRPDAMEVETATLRRAPLQVTVDAEGETRVRDRYVIAAAVSGRLERVPLAEGAVVRAGDVVARIAPAPFDEPSAQQARARLAGARAHAAEAETRVRGAAAAAVQARRDADRTRRLLEAGAVASRALEEADLAARAGADELAAARAAASAARADVGQAEAALLYAGGGTSGVVVVRAPTSGRVLRLPERSERAVAPGSLIVELGDTRRLEAVVDVLSSDAARVRPGMPVVLERWSAGDARAVPGRVRLVEPAATTRVSALGVEEQRVNVVVDVVDPPPALGDGYRVDAKIVVWSAADVVSAPASALVRDGGGWAMYAVEDGRAHLRPVRVGEMGGGMVQVLDGIGEGATVIVFPSDKVRGGVRVAAR